MLKQYSPVVDTFSVLGVQKSSQDRVAFVRFVEVIQIQDP